MRVRIFAFLTAWVILLSSCEYGKVEYFYFEFPDGLVRPADWQVPDVWFYRGDKVPLITKIDWNGETLQILNVNRCCVPFLEIRSPIALSNITITTGRFVSDFGDLLGESCVSILRYGEKAALLSWAYLPDEVPEGGCIRIGDEVSIELVPENGSEPLVFDATLVRSGYYRISTF